MLRHPRHSSGFTLIEALTATVILAVTVTAVTVPFAAGASSGQSDGRGTVAAALAQEMMEEVISKPFYDPQGSTALGPDGSETRTGSTKFDNIDDYHNYTEAAGAIKSMSGIVINDPATVGLSRRVTTTYVYLTGQSQASPATYIRVKVEVLYQGRPLVAVTRLCYAR